MPDQIYYQWQNEFLQQTIYPLRKTKLQDFLQFTFEFDVWAQYKDRKPDDLAGEVQGYRAAQKKKVGEAYDAYQNLEAYFMEEDVTGAYLGSFATPDPDVMLKINDLHKNFKRYFPTYQNPVKEKYFVSERARQFEEMRKKFNDQVKQKQRVLRTMGPTWGRKNAYEQEVARLSGISVKMVEQELTRLKDFLSAFARLESYRQELAKSQAQKKKDQDAVEHQLSAARAEGASLRSRLTQVQQALQQLAHPPDFEACRAYFLSGEVAGQYQHQFPEIDAGLLLKVTDLHKTFIRHFPGYKNTAQEKYFLNQRVKEFEDLRRLKTQELASKQRAAQWAPANSPNRARAEAAVDAFTKQVVHPLDCELEKLRDFQQAYERREKPDSFFAGQITQREKERAEIEGLLRKAEEREAAHASALLQLDAGLSVSAKEQLYALVDARPVTGPDLVRERVENYRAELAGKSHAQLLEAVVERFMKNPQRYPLWYQYMVIHFSGMRYQSAHGSWADPKDMLLALRSRAVDEEVRRTNPEVIEAMCAERFQSYQTGPEAGENELPALALTRDPEWRAKIDLQLKVLNPASRGYHKPKALLDLRIAEEEYEISQMTDQQALEELEGLKDQLPEWMWKEIVRLTDLRLKEVRDANWEQLSQADFDERYAREMGVYREILNRWKQSHITGWREEHDQANRLVVTRAVCNEVAEHIQHLRGQSPPGGLTAKPEWYLRGEKDPRLARAAEPAYLRKARSAADFKTGASILWLRWVNKEPNIWQITRPISLKNGEELIPLLKDANNIIQSTGSGFRRTVTLKSPDGTQRQDTQWLRWMHEATVVEAGETVDGPAILTFETALPYEDRSQSTIGVFKHPAAHLVYQVTPSVMNGVFVGFVPEGSLPYDDLKEMLDWNKVLQRNAYSAEEIQRFWDQVYQPQQEPVSFAAMDFGLYRQVEAAPACQPGQPVSWIVCRAFDSLEQRASLYEPEVRLRRGMRLEVSGTEVESDSTQTYYRVTACAAEPRAEGLYICEGDVIEAPEPGASHPVKAKKAALLYRMSKVTGELQPVFEPDEMQMAQGTRMRVSSVHKIGPADQGDGLIQAGRRKGYYLVVECPRISSAEGLFVRKADVRPISEKQYFKKALEL